MDQQSESAQETAGLQVFQTSTVNLQAPSRNTVFVLAEKIIVFAEKDYSSETVNHSSPQVPENYVSLKSFQKLKSLIS